MRYTLGTAGGAKLDRPSRNLTRFQCPCCQSFTLPEVRQFDVCPVCYWEDDGQDDLDADVVRGGPNGSLSLTAARQNYQRIGACEERFVELVRKPFDDERPSRA